MKINVHYYPYDPSSVAAIIAAVCFAVTTMVHTLQVGMKRSWALMPLTIGGYLEVIGYLCRIVSSYQSPNWTLPPFAVETVFILVAPAFFSASIYMLLGRIMVLVDGESKSIIRRSWLTKIFVCGDVLSLLLQAAGGALITSQRLDKIDHGKKIIDAGLFLQIFSFAIFLLTAVIFHYRLRRDPTAASTAKGNPWRKHLRVLYFTSSLIFIRCIVRVVQYIQGTTGYLSSHEVFPYVLDFLPMLVVMTTFNIFHPSEIYAVLRSKAQQDVLLYENISSSA